MASSLTKRTTSKAAAADGGAELFDPEFEEAKALGKERTEKGTSWGSDLQYVFAAIGSAVGLGNFLRFPSLAYRYGGFGFLLPYALAIVLVGVPVMGMENMFGQMLQRSAVSADQRTDGRDSPERTHASARDLRLTSCPPPRARRPRFPDSPPSSLTCGVSARTSRWVHSWR